jgi:hypothetical protein
MIFPLLGKILIPFLRLTTARMHTALLKSNTCWNSPAWPPNCSDGKGWMMRGSLSLCRKTYQGMGGVNLVSSCPNQILWGRWMPLIRVVYRAKEYVFDYVPSDLLESLITRDQITHFYRPSEERWVSIRLDPVRGSGGGYQGPERRRSEPKPNPNTGKGCLDAEARGSFWLEGLWRLIEGHDALG